MKKHKKTWDEFIEELSAYKNLEQDVSEKTLYRDLQKLVSKRILKEIGEKKGRRYELE